LERLKQVKYNKPHWLRTYIRGHEPPGPIEEEAEEAEEEATPRPTVVPFMTKCGKIL
jgi:hypothetical protein